MAGVDKPKSKPEEAGKDAELTAEELDGVVGGTGAIEITDYGFGVSMPVTTSRSDGGGSTTKLK